MNKMEIINQGILEIREAIGPLSVQQHVIHTAMEIERRYHPLSTEANEALSVLRRECYENRKRLASMNRLLLGRGQQNSRRITW